MSQSVLRVEHLHVLIAAMPALRGFSLSVQPGQMVGLIGRNGAGKTTLMRAIMGHLVASSGTVAFEGKSLKGQPAHTRSALGIGHMPEDRALVAALTVEENILLPLWATRILPKAQRLDLVYSLIPEVAQMRERKAQMLSGGQQKLVALARALAIGSRLLLLDEPFEGVAPALCQRLAQVIASLKGENLAVLISQSEQTHAHTLFDCTFEIERGANAAPPPAPSGAQAREPRAQG